MNGPDIPKMVDIIPEGKSGPFEVQHYAPPSWEVAQERRKWNGYGAGLGRYSQNAEGKVFAVLRDHSTFSGVVMSDTPMERESNAEVIRRAHGRVLIGGLGLGMVVLPLLTKPTVKEVVVVEVEKDVIKLVAPHIFRRDKEKRLTITKGSIYLVRPRGLFDTIYFDIWNEISGDNYTDILKLEERYRPYLAESGWMSAWMKTETRRLHARDE